MFDINIYIYNDGVIGMAIYNGKMVNSITYAVTKISAHSHYVRRII